MPEESDPWERAVAREATLRARASGALLVLELRKGLAEQRCRVGPDASMDVLWGTR